MIKNLKYKFYTTDYWPSIEYIKWLPEDIPEDVILEIEIIQLSWEYVREIVQELEEVVAWTRDNCIFWFETTLLFCYWKWKWYYWKLYPNTEVTITYDYWDEELITDLKAEEILKMMTEWRDYINAWEKETGKIKK